MFQKIFENFSKKAKRGVPNPWKQIRVIWTKFDLKKYDDKQYGDKNMVIESGVKTRSKCDWYEYGESLLGSF